MADSFLFDVADSLLGKLASYAHEEVSKAWAVFGDLQGIKDTLTIVKYVLLDAENKKDQNHGLQEWLKQIQNIFYDAEDVLDEVQCQESRNQFVQASGSKRLKVKHFFSSPFFRLRISHRIKDVRDRLNKVVADRNLFGLERMDVNVSEESREMSYSHVDALDVIGRGTEKEEIIELLMKCGGEDGDKGLSVIPMVGIGGLGKTTLAKLVFNDKRMDEVFELKMWVCVSYDFDIRKIIIKIINSTSTHTPVLALARQENIDHFDTEQLVRRLREKLSDQKFLLVLDDIWNVNHSKWVELKDLIKVGALGSKVLVTTRSLSIASMMGTVPVYTLEGLSLVNCLSLFVKWAFKEGEEKKYPRLLEIGEDMVRKCRGIPLAARTLGSSLFSKFDLDKWELVRDSEIWNLRQNKDDILPVLKLSYDQMPSHLRHCFAYFSLFPKDYLFSCGEICNLWDVFGLLQSPNGSQKLENISRDYIDELHSRSFLQDFEDFGHTCVFKVHDLVHDLAVYVAKEGFVMLNSDTKNIPEHARHLSVVENESLGRTLFTDSKSVRSILFPIQGVGLDSETLLDSWISRYRYLRYLDLSDSSFEALPNSISKLDLLRVLILSGNTKIKILPGCICELQNLQVLSVRGCTELEALPKGLGKLINLRQLFITTKQFLLSHDEFKSMIHLQTLGFHYCENLKFFSIPAQQLTSLESLFVQSCGSLDSLPLYIFPKLQTLLILNCKLLNPWLNDESLITNSSSMKHLYLGDFPNALTLPHWIVGAANTLLSLVIKNLPNLTMLPEFLTTMTCLKRLHIVDCPQLSRLPTDIHRLVVLEDLSIDGCPELCRKCQPRVGEYWPVISHVKHVFIGEPKGEEN
ncbi:disease resistance protein RGA2 [Lathyrus oleraceus]|uniref:Uncharacterized protein n=1 Tax=Pisum sativum TaxID=3888 RepID=A0A9D5AE76_PEA|nr:disease resistance protein RGA2-like [Pisum sativum]XP_050875092.1 disease resistance protein RGA2-like [Pisum sativum]XP_050875093.1 disease resistance protein RGA2-like [Pisum sativum]KAI5404784.1 hypothetical protein KIW84_051809 [Pisum sativum]